MHRYAVPDLRWLGICNVHLQGVAQDTFQMLSNRDRLVSGLAWTTSHKGHVISRLTMTSVTGISPWYISKQAVSFLF